MGLVNTQTGGSGGGSGLPDAIFQIQRVNTPVGSAFALEHVAGDAFAGSVANTMVCNVAGDYVLSALIWPTASGNHTLRKNGVDEAVFTLIGNDVNIIATKTISAVGDEYQWVNNTASSTFPTVFTFEWRLIA